MGQLAPHLHQHLREHCCPTMRGLTEGLAALHSRVIMSRHRAIIKDLGGYAVVANHLGLHEETVKSWLKCDRGIPARHWHRIAMLAGLTVAQLERTSPKWRQTRGER